jgi:hypothetical protein
MCSAKPHEVKAGRFLTSLKASIPLGLSEEEEGNKGREKE